MKSTKLTSHNTAISAHRYSLICMISARNLGDAVGHADVLSELIQRGFTKKAIVWTKPESAFLFEKIDACEIITSPLPLGTARNFSISDFSAVIRAAHKIRKLRPDLTLDLIGDFRERLLGRLSGARRHIQINWALGHPFNNLIRNPFGKKNQIVTVRSNETNIYSAQRKFIETFCPEPSPVSVNFVPRLTYKKKQLIKNIGLHPFASQQSKIWPYESWHALASFLSNAGNNLTAFGSPAERSKLELVFKDIPGNIRFVTGTLAEFDAVVSCLDLMIGLDSFAVHMAYRHRVPSIMLNSGNPPEMWRTPTGVVVGDGHGCSRFPCFNVPRCEENKELICIRGTSVNDVIVAVQQLSI